MLQDDKSYPYLKITAERHPQLVITRSVKEDEGKYFGPNPNVQAAKNTKKLLEHLYPLRRCKLSQSRPCLYDQIGLCIGPCAREVSPEMYQERIDQISQFLDGHYKQVKKQTQQKMKSAVANLDFEKAEEFHKLVTSIEETMEKQQVTSDLKENLDIFGFAVQNKWLAAVTFFLRNGKINDGDIQLFQLNQQPNLEVVSFLRQFYEKNQRTPPDAILLQSNIRLEKLEGFFHTKLVQPKRGRKKSLVDFAVTNAKFALQDKLSMLERKD